MKGSLLCGLLIVALQLGLCWARCESLFPGNAGQKQLPSSCYGVLNYEVFIPEDTCQAEIETQTFTWPTAWETIRKNGFPNAASCSNLASQFMCQSIFSSCTGASNGQLSAPVGLPPCRETCQDFVDTCSGNALAGAILATAGPEWWPYNCTNLPTIASGMCNTNNNPSIRKPQPMCIKYNGTACKGVADSYIYDRTYYGNAVTPRKGMVYIFAGFTPEQMEIQAQKKFFLFNLAGPRDDCQKWMAPYICGQIFPACDDVTRILSPQIPLPSTSVPFPRFLCEDVCLNFKTACSYLWTDDNGVVDTTNPLYPNCTQRVIAPGRVGTCSGQGYIESPYQQDYPPQRTLFKVPPYDQTNATLDQYNVYTACNNFSRTPTSDVASINFTVMLNNVVCPPPLVLRNSPTAELIKDGRCSAPCPVLLFSDDDYTNVDILQTTLVVVSFFLALFVALTWVVFKQKRAQKYVLYFNLSILMIMVILVTFVANRGGGRHVAEIGCKSNAETYDNSDQVSWCIVGGALVVWSVMHSVAWWFISALDLFLKIVIMYRPLETSKANKAKEWFFRISAPLVPAILVSIALGENIMGAADLGVAWCQFHQRTPGKQGLEWILLYFPVLAIAVFAFTFMIAIMVSLCRSAQATGTNRRKGWWKRYLRPIMFLAAFLAIFVWIFAFRVAAWYQQETWLENAQDWVKCLLVDGPVGLRDCAPDKPEGGPSVVLWNLIHVAVAGTGIYTFMIYGIMEENFRLWAKFFGECCNNDSCRIWGAGAAALRQRASTVNGPKKGSKGNDAVKLNMNRSDGDEE